MKKILILAGISVVMLLSCHSTNHPIPVQGDSAVPKAATAYPFAPKYSLNWQPGDEKNALLVLNCL